MDDIHKIVLYLRVRTWFAILHQARQPLQSIVDCLVNVMSLVENRSDGDRIPPPVHAVVVIFVHDAFQRLNRTDGFSLILVAKFIIPLDSSFFGHVVLQNGDADVPQVITVLLPTLVNVRSLKSSTPLTPSNTILSLSAKSVM